MASQFYVLFVEGYRKYFGISLKRSSSARAEVAGQGNGEEGGGGEAGKSSESGQERTFIENI